MKVKKSLNNSMLLAENDGKEMILFGKGIGFNTKQGQLSTCKVSNRSLCLWIPSSRDIICH
ncbi:hypothetical protein AZZ61_000695 [Klebsiella variicola]|nr:hypothetical protein L386_02025 [Klebsiella variicola]OUG48266.1 hypothetical protein AZZ61_000695 [Klebsiella variicola]